MNKEFHAIMCNADVNPYKVHKVVDSRFEVINQKLQHQVDESFRFNHTPSCMIHNTMPPCKDSKCELPHICSSCGDHDHIATDSRCPKIHLIKDWYLKRHGEVNRYYNNKSRRTRSFNNGRGPNKNVNYQKFNNESSYLPNLGPSFNNSNNNSNNRDERD